VAGPRRCTPYFRRLDLLAVGEREDHLAAAARLAALGAEARRRADALAAIGVVGRRDDLDLVVAAGAAAEAAGPAESQRSS
jgi:hypothetical protein